MVTLPHTVRSAQAGDMPAICELVNFYVRTSVANFRTTEQSAADWRDRWERTREAYPWYVAVSAPGDGVAGSGGIAGIAGIAYAQPWSPREAYAWTAESTVYVADGHRGKGVGSALYAALLTCLQEQGFRSVIAGITLPNPGSEALHRTHGFTPAGTFRAAGFKHGGWHDVGYFQRQLRNDRRPPRAPRPVPGSGDGAAQYGRG